MEIKKIVNQKKFSDFNMGTSRYENYSEKNSRNKRDLSPTNIKKFQNSPKSLSELVSGAILNEGEYMNLSFSGVIAIKSVFLFCDLSGCNFINSILKECDFTFANLQNCNFNGAILEGCSFRHTILKNSTFIGADILFCDFTGAEI